MNYKTHAFMEFAAKLARQSDLPTTRVADLAALLIRDASSLHRLAEKQCNDSTFGDKDVARRERLSARIRRNAEQLGCTGVVLKNDPRGAVAKVTFKDGNTHDFASEGWCVPRTNM